MTLLHRLPAPVALEDLERDVRRAVAGWDWRDGAFGHALSLPAGHQLHPYGRHLYQNFPCTGLLDSCPAFRAVFDELLCEKVSFRLLRRAAGSAYAWHTDRWKGPGVVRFQIPIVSPPSAFLVLTDHRRPEDVRGPRNPGAESLSGFADVQREGFERHHLEPGWLHYFDTSRVHTLVNPGPGERITLSFDLVANDWLRERVPAIREELGDATWPTLRRPGKLRSGLAAAFAHTHPLRSRTRRWLGRDASDG